jgi:hypothetical protein
MRERKRRGWAQEKKEDLSAPKAAWVISLCGEGGLGKTAIAYEAVARYKEAHDHLLLSQEIFDTIQFSSSGRLQVSLAWAALYSKEGNCARAREFILVFWIHYTALRETTLVFLHSLTSSQFTLPIRSLWQKLIRIG